MQCTEHCVIVSNTAVLTHGCKILRAILMKLNIEQIMQECKNTINPNHTRETNLSHTTHIDLCKHRHTVTTFLFYQNSDKAQHKNSK